MDAHSQQAVSREPEPEPEKLQLQLQLQLQNDLQDDLHPKRSLQPEVEPVPVPTPSLNVAETLLAEPELEPDLNPPAELESIDESQPLLAPTDEKDSAPKHHKPLDSTKEQDPTQHHDPTIDQADLMAKAIDFLATASSSTLSTVAATLALLVYIVFGRIGLVLIGAVGGIAVFISYDGRSPQQLRQVRSEVGAELLQRLLSTSPASAAYRQDSSLDKTRILAGLDDFPPLTRAALLELIDAAIRDYVQAWYRPIVPSDESFSLSCRDAITNYIVNISNHVSRKRPADVFLDLTTNSVSMLIVFFSELATAFAQVPPDSSNSAAYTVYNYLAEHPDSNLANLLNQRQQAAKLKTIAEDLLTCLDQPLFACPQTRIFLREIVSGVILEKTLLSCSRPEWINGWVVALLEAGEPDFSQAIDVGMQSKPDAKKLANLVADNALKADEGLKAGQAEGLRTGQEETPDQKRVSKSKAQEETQDALEEMQRMNQMIVEAQVESRRSVEAQVEAEPPKTPTMAAQDQKTGSQSSPEAAAIHTPATPASRKSAHDDALELELESSPINELRPFTSFDQMMPPIKDTSEEDEAAKKAPLTLHNCTITVHDDDTDSTWKLLGKPNWEYLVQVEPASSHYPGWMVVRKYSDFESLHEILRRIASVSGSSSFGEQHAILPSWKGHTRSSLRTELERYLRDACWYQPLAESEGMKRFLDKDQGMPKVPEKSLFRWNAVGDMLDAVADAPKGALQGGKAVVGGLFGSIGNLGKRNSHALASAAAATATATAAGAGASSEAAAAETKPELPAIDTHGSPQSTPSLVSIKGAHEDRSSQQSTAGDDSDSARKSQYERWERISQGDGGSNNSDGNNKNNNNGLHSRASSLGAMISPRSPSSSSIEHLYLPPPPDKMTDNIETSVLAASRERGNSVLSQGSGPRPAPPSRHGTFGSAKVHVKSDSTAAMPEVAEEVGVERVLQETDEVAEGEEEKEEEKREEKKKEEDQKDKHPPLTEPETRVAVELLFAVINELYTLSSAWNFRRTLLTAAKSFLLRPGNPSLVAIQDMIQTSVLDANTADSGLAAYVDKVREAAMPTAAEIAAWPAEMTGDEKEQLRVKARRLLIESGLPEALKGVMGQSATSEALGRLFDCLQMEEVARGLVFGLLLQTVRIITH